MRLSILALLVLAPAASAQLTVVSIDPPMNASNVAPNHAITVDFDRAVAPSSLGAFDVYGGIGGPGVGATTLENGGLRIRFRPERPWFAGEVVTVGMADTLRAVDGTFLRTAGYVTSFRVVAGAAPATFSQIDSFYTEPGIFTRIYGAQYSDIDGDDSIDMTVISEVTSDVRVFKNRGDGTGLYVTPNYSVTVTGQTPSPNEHADMNGDGNIDVITCNTGGDSVSILRGNGNGSFQPALNYPMGGDPRGLAILDADGDGDMDVATANNGTGNIALALNNGSGVLGAPTLFNGGGDGEFALTAADMNNDGIMDLVVGLRSTEEIIVLRGNGNATFTPLVAHPAGGQTWMIVAGDVDADGNLDISIAASFSNVGAIVLGNGNGTFQPPQTVALPSFAVATDLGDLDGDGDLDWVVSSFGAQEWFVYRNDAGTFNPLTSFTSTANPGCASIFDFDDDRDLDIVLLTETSDEIRLQRNGPATHTTFCYGTDAICPCANGGQPHAGCDHSFGTGGGRLVTSGIASIGGDTLALNASGLPSGVSTLFFQGTSTISGGTGAVFGDGLRCVAGVTIRLGIHNTAGGWASYGEGTPGDIPISVRGLIPPGGGQRHYQAWYRNAATFCSGFTFNLTNGVTVNWVP